MANKIFVSYSHQDAAWLERLLVHLKPLEQEGLEVWADTRIPSGAQWREELERALATAKVAVLLISADFLASDFIVQHELPPLLAAAQAQQLKILPVIVQPCALPKHLESFQAVNDPINALSRLSQPDQEAVFVEVFRAVEEQLQSNDNAQTATGWNVPQRNPFFTGRDQVFETLSQALVHDGVTALTQTQVISGLGGIGKTQTAVEYAYRHAANYTAVLWVQAESAEEIREGFAALADVLDIPQRHLTDQDQMIVGVKRWLQHRSGWLLIFDNADHPQLVTPFLPHPAQGHILLTSRAQVFDMLGIAEPIGLDKMPLGEARHFLLTRTGRHDLGATEEDALSQLLHELDGLPLALEQAGAYILRMQCSFQNYVTRYRNRGITLLQRGEVVTGQYPESVATTWALSFDHVAKVSQPATDLLYVSAFLSPDRIPLELIRYSASELGLNLTEALQDVKTDPLALDEVLEPLTQFSLIRRDLRTYTYTIHRLVQGVIKDGMDEPTQRLWVERVVRATSRVFPRPIFSRWLICNRLLPQARLCAQYIDQWGFVFREAGDLLGNAGAYLYDWAHSAEAARFFEKALAIDEAEWGKGNFQTAPILNNLAGICRDQGRFDEAEQLYQRVLSMVETELGADHPACTPFLRNLAACFQEQGRFDKAKALLERALALAEAHWEGDHPEIASSLRELATLYVAQGLYPEAERLLQRALSIWETALGADHPDTALGFNQLGMLYHAQSRYDEAEPLLQRALTIFETHLGANHAYIATTLNNLGTLYIMQGRYDEAEQHCQRALATWETTLGEDHPDIVKGLTNLGALYVTQGRYDTAEPWLQRALSILRTAWGESYHPDFALTLLNVADLYRIQGRFAEAEPLMQEALAIMEAKLGAAHLRVGEVLTSVGSLYMEQGRSSEAESTFQRALTICETAGGHEHSTTAACLNGLAVLYIHQERYDEAEPRLERALAIWETALGDQNLSVARAMSNLAYVYAEQGRSDDAERLYQRAVTLYETLFGESHPELGALLNNFASHYSEQGQYETAESLLKRALSIAQTTFGATHPAVGKCLYNLAFIYAEQRRLEEAEPLLRQCMELLEAVLGEAHPEVLMIMEDYAGLLREMSRTVEAEAIEARMRAIQKRRP